MKKYLILSALSLGLIMCLNSPAGAMGIGAYGGFSYNEGHFEGVTHPSINYNAKYYWGGGGLVIDTAVAKKKLFNFRLNLGFGKLYQEHMEGSYPRDIEGLRGELITSYGFGIVKVSFLRMWLGPQLGIRFSHIVDNEFDVNYDCLLFSPGAVLGFNFNIGSIFTIAIDGGFRYNAGFNFITPHNSSDLLNYDSETTYGPEGFANLSIIFRIGDTYPSEKKEKEVKSEEKSKEAEPEKEKEQEKSDKGKDKDKVSSDEDYWFGN